MPDFFSSGLYGKQHVISHHDQCEKCRHRGVLNSYTTQPFVGLHGIPLIPSGRRIYILNECPHCGHRGCVSRRKHRRQQKKDLASMMKAFSSEPDYPDTALNGLHTLMTYDEESWFMDCTHSYGRRFETHMQVQLKIAEGLSRFGRYAEASNYCRAAIVLGAGSRGEELLTFCQSQLQKEEAGMLTGASMLPESMLRPYAFTISVFASLCIGFIVAGAIAMRTHTAWLVSGAPIPYAVELDGKRHHLEPYESKSIRMRLGEHHLLVEDLPGYRVDRSFKYETSLLRQKFRKHALILNPDAMAVLQEETLQAGQKTQHYNFGGVVNALDGIHYPFAAFPPWSGSKRSTQTRLSVHAAESPPDQAEFIRTHFSPADAAQYARRALQSEPSNAASGALFSIATHNLDAQQALGFLRQELSARPVLIPWHLAYQDFVSLHFPEHDLPAEYAQYCKNDPACPELFFLTGRVIHNHDTAEKFFEKSEEGSGSGGAGYHAIAYDLLCKGEFSKAQSYINKALNATPDNSAFQALSLEINLALNQYNPLIQRVRSALTEDQGNIALAAQLITYLTMNGEHQRVNEIISTMPTEAQRSASIYAARYYAVGNTADYLDNLARSGQNDALLQQRLHSGNVKEAHSLLSQNENHDYTAHLILYCAAQRYKHPDIAGTEWTKALAEFSPSNPARREEWIILSEAKPPSTSQLLNLRIPPAEKALLCATLGFKFPERQADFFRLSKKFNYTPEHPQLLLKKWMRQPAPAPE